MWTDKHPRGPGLWWVSVEPKGRNPQPWVKLPPVFALSIDGNGDVRQVLPHEDAGGWDVHPEVLYTTSTLPKFKSLRVKYQRADGDLVVSEIDDETLPEDPWVADQAAA